METVLQVDGVSKAYGKVKALKQVSLTIPKGSVFGILGPNGSGKTTLMSIVLDVLGADTGTYSWFNQPPTAAARKRIGSLLETPNFYHYLSAVDNLKITSAISGRGNDAAIDEVIEIVKLTERKKSKFSTYSLGMKQRLAIAAALLGNPEVLLLDEPTNGLDPVGILEIRELIRRLANKGITIIIASHLLDEVEKICSHVAILKRGTLLTSGPVDEVLSNEDIVEVAATDMQALKGCIEGMQNVLSIKEDNQRIQIHFPAGTANLEEVNQFCFSKGITLNLLLNKKQRLESKFFELTND
ncbi:ABC transporter ATP-binding protein [Sediminibacterium sp.]|jgi:ABC-2 type transport system ATP-binding protein|uniref:ABC transporter ATP-binding protein n=1 Tax=Sediminibacterium sp. TaxID=1917865 RepID=UPI000BC48BC2|nr:ATP-binding cassette domain-containing protein [Sediminibacterium sp.]MDP3392490.1 ATP-binding cassette domain-containing protein [Sediminibacterium sp.]MDP3565756.1 ATP-binding cassette domain-containing protein [Sediminibacterium sp.]OYW81915.1 MAG: ABC transporter ATP-binding protein [Sphingobacteriia bacterium 32-37-4]OYZ00940.1 MAG: ABC transporter ATP-binding protein [Sphingobacteriia bacterium 28-36-52]